MCLAIQYLVRAWLKNTWAISSILLYSGFKSKMGKKVTLSEIKRLQIVIWHKKVFCQRKICRKVSCSKFAVHQATLDFKILDFLYLPPLYPI